MRGGVEIGSCCLHRAGVGDKQLSIWVLDDARRICCARRGKICLRPPLSVRSCTPNLRMGCNRLELPGFWSRIDVLSGEESKVAQKCDDRHQSYFVAGPVSNLRALSRLCAQQHSLLCKASDRRRSAERSRDRCVPSHSPSRMLPTRSEVVPLRTSRQSDNAVPWF